MQVRFALGTELDIATKGELDSGLDSLGDRILKGSKPAQPFRFGITRAGLMPASGALVLDFNFPPAGRAWNIVGVTTFGVDDATTTTGAKVAIYCGDPSNLGLSQLKVPALTVPSFTSVPRLTMWCLRTETLVANVTGASATAPIGVTVHVAEWKETDVFGDTGK